MAQAVEEALRKDRDCPAEKETPKKGKGRGQASEKIRSPLHLTWKRVLTSIFISVHVHSISIRLTLASRVALFLQVPSSHNCQLCCAGIVVTHTSLLIDSNVGAFESMSKLLCVREQRAASNHAQRIGEEVSVYLTCMLLFGSSRCKANRVRVFKQGFRELQLALTQIMYAEEAK